MISCGEPSGDLYAGALATELLRLEPETTIVGLGGRRLREAGAALTADFSGATFEAAAPGSVLEKLGAGTLQFLPPFLYPSTAANTWGVKATAGTLIMNQLPGVTTPSNGSVIFDGGKLVQVGSADPGSVCLR